MLILSCFESLPYCLVVAEQVVLGFQQWKNLYILCLESMIDEAGVLPLTKASIYFAPTKPLRGNHVSNIEFRGEGDGNACVIPEGHLFRTDR